MSDPAESVQLDLNNPVFQRQWFALSKEAQWSVLGTLRKLAGMTWGQVYQDVASGGKSCIPAVGRMGGGCIVSVSVEDFGVWPIVRVRGCASCHCTQIMTRPIGHD